jgi:hypothetical protein
MENIPTIEDVLREPASIDDVVNILEEIIVELRSGSPDWENTTLESYLEAMQAWLESFRSRLGDKPSWRTVVVMLRAARHYE